jgi:hypothetical protein
MKSNKGRGRVQVLNKINKKKLRGWVELGGNSTYKIWKGKCYVHLKALGALDYGHKKQRSKGERGGGGGGATHNK